MLIKFDDNLFIDHEDITFMADTDIYLKTHLNGSSIRIALKDEVHIAQVRKILGLIADKNLEILLSERVK